MLSIGTPPPNTTRPGGLQELAPLPRQRRFWWLIPLMIAALIVGSLVWWRHRPPTSVGGYSLSGPRTPTPICLAVLLDESGSFTDYEPIRRNALNQILTWSTQNLRPDDCIGIVSFAGTAYIKMNTVSVGDIATGNYSIESGTLGRNTNIEPAMKLVSSIMPGNVPSSLIVISDTEVGDATSGDLNSYVAAMKATTMTLIIPKGEHVTDGWNAAFPYESVVTAHSESADETGIALGKAIAHATNQTLSTR